MEWFLIRIRMLGFPDPEEFYREFVHDYGLDALDMFLTDLESDLYVD